MPPVSPEHQHQQQRDQTTADQTSAASGSAGDGAGDREVPLVETIAPVVDEVIDIARQHLDEPISVKIKTWEDRTFQVRVRHSYGRSPRRYRYMRETAVQYHSNEEVVEGFLIEEDRWGDNDRVLHRETLATIESPTEKNAAWMTD